MQTDEAIDMADVRSVLKDDCRFLYVFLLGLLCRGGAQAGVTSLWHTCSPCRRN